MTSNKNRCVITGLGMISAIGSNVDECWEKAIHSYSGINEATSVDTTGCYATIGAEVKDNSLNDLTDLQKFDRVSKLCGKATKEALKDAHLGDFQNNPRVSVIMGSCVGGAVTIEKYFTNGRKKEDIVQMPISAIATQMAGICHAGGVVTNIANACAAGTISIAYACDLIRAGKADIVIAGGADAFASVPYAGFLSLHALDANRCSPFNHCSGINLGEGSGVVIVESYKHAKDRNAKIYCEVLGSGISSDAYHITAPRPDGKEQINAIKKALNTSGLTPKDIGYVNAHGTGTAKNDNAEFLSLHTIFDEENDYLNVSSTKAMTGHCLGAAGAIEAVFAIKALTNNIIPPTLGFSEDDLVLLQEKAGKMDFTPNIAKEKKLSSVMNNSFAFGGTNASIIFSKEEGNVQLESEKKEICLTGFGIVSPFGNGIENYIQHVNEKSLPESNSIFSKVGLDDYNHLGLAMSFYRKLDNICQLQAVSGMYALDHAQLKIDDSNASDVGMIIGTSEGALGTSCLFEENIAQNGNYSGSAFKFPNTVYNAAGGYLSICSGIKGYNVTITNGIQSGLASVAYAMNVIRQGKEKIMLATGSDENIAIIHELYEKLGYLSQDVVKPYSKSDGFVLSDGSTTIVLEEKQTAVTRNAKIYCYAIGYGMAHKNVEFGTLKNSEDALKMAILNAVEDAQIQLKDIDAIFGFANGHVHIDEIEMKTYENVFKEKLETLPVIAIKEMMGEGRAATANLACVHAALMLSEELKEDEAYLMKNHQVQKTRIKGKDLRYVLVTSYASGGSYCAIVLAKKEN